MNKGYKAKLMCILTLQTPFYMITLFSLSSMHCINHYSLHPFSGQPWNIGQVLESTISMPQGKLIGHIMYQSYCANYELSNSQ